MKTEENSEERNSQKEVLFGQNETNENAPNGWEIERESRETWAGKIDFMLSAIGYAVGLGNVWRFPYICFKNGGGAFLVPYFIFLALCGIPLCVLEMSLGQFVSLCPTALFQKFCPMFQGLGWSQVLVSGICAIYYNMIIGWALYYLVLSLRATLLWSSCGNWWNSENCVVGIKYLESNLANVSYANNTNYTLLDKKTASEEFWENYVLRIHESSGIDDIGAIQWELLIALATAWLIVFFCLSKGVHTSGKVVYVTATFPYVLLLVLMIRGITLPGALNGIKYYLIPKWEKLMDLDVWVAAASQIFYSVAPAWGVLITFASFNKFNHKIYRDATIIPLINCGSSVFIGIVVFSIIGFMAKEAGKDVGDVIASGPGLAFIVYPEVLANFPLSPMWSVFFFLMILTVGLDSQFGQFETFIMAFVDTWPGVLRKRKTLFTGFLCLITFILGLPCTTEGGMYVLQLMDWYVATFSVMLIGTIECLLVGYNYGVKRISADIYLMNGRYPSKWYPIAWTIVTPIVVLSIMIANLVKHTPVTYDDYKYPGWAVAIGWMIAVGSSLPIPIYMFINVFLRRRHMPIWERIVDAMRPTPDWGPSQLENRSSYCKSLNMVPSKQLYVQGIENLVEMVPMKRNDGFDAVVQLRLPDSLQNEKLD